LASARPRFSIVTAVYNVEPYLPDFIASIEAQHFDPAQIEVIAVDDGSTDGSAAILEEWAARSRVPVEVLRQPNAGQAAARNLGLDHANGEWVTFTDPDDILDADFFHAADAFLRAHPEVEVASSKPLLFNEAFGEITDSHPRGRQYATGNRVVDLERQPNVFTGSASVSFFRLDRIRGLELHYDARVRPNFEDGHFAVRYLMGLERPLVGIAAGAKYIYRKRSAGDSTLQQSASDPGRYTDVFEFGYLDVLRAARRRYGRVPPWLQHVIIYELSWYLSEDEKIVSRIRLSPDLAPRFHELFDQVRELLEPEVVRDHTVRRLKSIWSDIFEVRPGTDWHGPIAARTKVDVATGLQRIQYRFTGAPPAEEFLLDGRPITPPFAKTMAHIYYRRALMNERVAWLPTSGTLRLRLGGRDVPIVSGWPPAPSPRPSSVARRMLLYARLTQSYVIAAVRRRARSAARRGVSTLVGAPLHALARTPAYRSRFANAWVLMDRMYDADDNAERLFEHLRGERPDINAWFVIRPESSDWPRLRRTYGDRAVAHGSFRWKMLMLNCEWFVSSHADLAIVTPSAVMRIAGGRTWKYAFLQHGVIKDDLSLWLNARDIDMFVTSTRPELESVAGDGTTYVYTTKEARNTGLPRFDRLLAKGAAVPSDDRKLVIVAPTWRTWLTLPIDRRSNRRDVSDEFWSSEYFRTWDAVLRSPAVAEAIARRGWRLAFMPHPNMQPVLARMDLPGHVEALTFAGNDVQDLYAHCALLVTDYSSVAFNAAYLDRPVVYFQFDRDAMMSGAHMGREGYFDYERDGFGPVATHLDAAIRAIVEAIEHGPEPTPEYAARIEATFVNRDGGACRRVVAAIEELSRRYVPEPTSLRARTDASIDPSISPGRPG
jgi:glycosyltransferase involved in cell wall biosynthesis